MDEYPQKGMVIRERQKDSTPLKVTEVNPVFVTGVSLGEVARPRKVRMRTVRQRFTLVRKPRDMETFEWGATVG